MSMTSQAFTAWVTEINCQISTNSSIYWRRATLVFKVDEKSPFAMKTGDDHPAGDYNTDSQNGLTYFMALYKQLGDFFSLDKIPISHVIPKLLSYTKDWFY